MKPPFPGRRRTSPGLRPRGASGVPLVGTLGTDRAGWFAVAMFAFYGLAIFVTCFVGIQPGGPSLVAGQIARFRVVAEFPFTYESALRTEALRDERRARVPPAYQRSLESAETFGVFAQELLHEMEATDSMERRNLAALANRLSPALARLDPEGRWGLAPEDAAVLARDLNPTERAELVAIGLETVRELLGRGLVPPETDSPGSVQFLGLADEGPGTLLSPEEALRLLRARLLVLPHPREVTGALYRLLRGTLAPNLVFDPEATLARREAAAAAVPPVEITIEAGASLVEPGQRVRPQDVELIEAYRNEQIRRRAEGRGDRPLLDLRAPQVEPAVLTAIIMCAVALTLKIGNRRLRTRLRILRLGGAILLLNLILLRILAEMGVADFAGAGSRWALVLPFFAPIAFGPIFVSVLLGPFAGVVTAALVAIFHGLMQGGALNIALVSFLAGIIAVHASREVQVRSRLLRASLLAGLVPAFGALLFGIREDLSAILILSQIGAALGSGLLTFILVLGLLPVFEKAFQLTSDISLLELTDFNHPLLRRLQMEAPGSYHHSLMVANLSENAASAVGGSPLTARVCALYHDIGKLVKPEYFTENQRDGENPHLERSPSISALIIKSHVKEGVQIARQYRLPKIIQNVIQQHHGTTLIQYFYYKALEQRRPGSTPNPFQSGPAIDLDQVNESTYRYEGPKPDFLESAIIFFADSVEAASRSLRKVTPQNIDELIEKIFRDRLEDDQLSECPLTLQQIARIKKSFSFTLLTMLHSRVEYPSRPGSAPTAPRPRPEEAASAKPDPAAS